jgi:hypothetical protein
MSSVPREESNVVLGFGRGTQERTRRLTSDASRGASCSAISRQSTDTGARRRHQVRPGGPIHSLRPPHEPHVDRKRSLFEPADFFRAPYRDAENVSFATRIESSPLYDSSKAGQAFPAAAPGFIETSPREGGHGPVHVASPTTTDQSIDPLSKPAHSRRRQTTIPP